MKKSTLFVLLLAAVLLFMTACNPATKEPAATDDPTKIPGVAEDPNVPSNDKLVAATPEDIKLIIDTLNFDIKSATSIDGSSSRTIRYTLKENAKIDIDNNPNTEPVDISGSVTAYVTSNTSEQIIKQGWKSSTTYTIKYNGTVKLGDEEYKMENFVITTKSSHDDSITEGNNYSSSTEYEGSVKKKGTPISKDELKAFAYILYSSINKDTAEEKYIDSNQTFTFNYNLSKLKGSVSIMMDTRDYLNGTAVIIADFSNIKDHSITAKFVASVYDDGTGVPSIKDKKFEYASFDGKYFTSESLVVSDELVNRLLYLMSN